VEHDDGLLWQRVVDVLGRVVHDLCLWRFLLLCRYRYLWQVGVWLLLLLLLLLRLLKRL
jgi:hypothetical protein